MIFLYHGVVPDTRPRERWCAAQALPGPAVERQLEWLARHFRIVPVSAYLAENLERHPRRTAAITFDDGAKATFDNIAPFLRVKGLPATFFVATGHLCGGPLLWFSYLNALCFEPLYAEVIMDGRRFSLATLAARKASRRALGAMAKRTGRPSDFCTRIGTVYPLAAETLELYAGMTRAQLEAAGKDDLLEIGAHTVSHPYLSETPGVEQAKEIVESKAVLESLTARPVRYFAYPSGDYDEAVVLRVRQAGYDAAFATRPRRIGFERLEIGRVGIYSRSMLKFRLKAAGAVELAERAGLRAG